MRFPPFLQSVVGLMTVAIAGVALYDEVPKWHKTVFPPFENSRFVSVQLFDNTHVIADAKFDKLRCDFKDIIGYWKPSDGFPGQGTLLFVDYGQVKSRPRGSHSAKGWIIEAPTNGKQGVVEIYAVHDCLWGQNLTTHFDSFEWPLESGATDAGSDEGRANAH